MFFTQEDFRKIEKWLNQRTIKDTDFNKADPLSNSDIVPIIQDRANKITTVKQFIEAVENSDLVDFVNVTTLINKGSLTLSQAINAVPSNKRKLGLAITFHSEKGNWVIYQFNGAHINQWNSPNCWRSIIDNILEELVLLHPDEEDTTEVIEDGKSFVKFKDRNHTEEFTPKGMVILRRNVTGTTACSVDDQDHLINPLTQEMVADQDTIYVIRYEFDLQGKTINLPPNCTLKFDGGTLNNGTINCNNTSILGAFSFNTTGNANYIGNYAVGQVMAFYETRKVLKWYDGTEWKLLLDITDYNNILDRISAVVQQHNKDVEALNKKIKDCNDSISALSETVNTLSESVDSRFEATNKTVESNSKGITDLAEEIKKLRESQKTLKDTIDGLTDKLKETVDSYIEEYIESNEIGTTSITINDTTYNVDENHNITVPSISADQLKGKLIIQTNAGDILGTFDGSENVTATLPEVQQVEAGEPIVNKPLTIKSSSNNILATYTGEVEKEVTLPAPAKITFKGIGDTDIEYNGVNPLTVNLSSINSSSSNEGIRDLSPVKILWSGVISVDSSGVIAQSTTANWGGLFEPVVSRTGVRVDFSLNYRGSSNFITGFNIVSGIPVIGKLSGIPGTGVSEGNINGPSTFITCVPNGTGLSMIAYCKNDSNQRSFGNQGFYSGSATSKEPAMLVKSFFLTVIGTVNFAPGIITNN